jgi:integrase
VHVRRGIFEHRFHALGIATIVLWLGHEQINTTLIYLHADLRRKQEALDKTAPLATPAGRYTPPPDILTFLASL